MSRGMGDIQRGCLEVLGLNKGGPLDSVMITVCVVCRDEVTASEHSSVRRALRKLADAGKVVAMSREGWSDGRRRWMLPEAHAAFIAECKRREAEEIKAELARRAAENKEYNRKYFETHEVGPNGVSFVLKPGAVWEPRGR